MKVYIGPYINRITSNVHDNHMNKKYDFVDWPPEKNWTKVDRAYEFIDDRLQDFYNWTINLYLDSKHRKVKIRIDEYDTWSMDSTIAEIILPMLMQLKATTHGAPFVDLKDVPKELHGEKLTKKQRNNGAVDEKHFERWDWVLDEMIFAFSNKVNEDWHQDQFHSGVSDIQFKELADGNSEMINGPKHTRVTDWDGYKAYQKRITNGFSLFGKYFESLWD